MLKQVLDIFKVVPDYDMAIMKKRQDLTDVTTAILTGMREILKKEKPDIVLVHGDTSTAFAASLAAFYQQIPVGHVEAGLRTYNMKSPIRKNLTAGYWTYCQPAFCADSESSGCTAERG